MRIKGSSESVKVIRKSGLFNERKLEDSESELHEVDDYLSKKVTYFLASWISIVDKVVAKDRNLVRKIGTGNVTRKKVSNEETSELREKIGAACIKYWLDNQNLKNIPDELFSDNGELDQKIKSIWFKRKIHPTAKPKIDADEIVDSGIVGGRWFSVFFPETNINELKDEQIIDFPKQIYNHLYIEQRRLGAKSANKKEGLLLSRHNSVSQNALCLDLQNSLEFTPTLGQRRTESQLNDIKNGRLSYDWEKEKKDYQLIGLVKNLRESITFNERYSEQREKMQQALRNHYDFVFGKVRISDAKKSTLWPYHELIKDALNFYFPKKRKKSQRKFDRWHDEAALHQLAIRRYRNRLTSLVIRLGKILHYEGDVFERNMTLENLDSSHYLTTDGQIAIKQSESFVRHWLNALTFANHSMERLLDPNRSVISKGRNIFELGDEQTGNLDAFEVAFLENVAMTDRLDELNPNLNEQVEQFFGSDHQLYDEGENDQRLHFLQGVQRCYSRIRNASFHFKDFASFAREIHTLFPHDQAEGQRGNDLIERAHAFCKRERELHLQETLDSINAVKANEYLDQNVYEKVIEYGINSETGTLQLPNLNSVLLRTQNKRKKFDNDDGRLSSIIKPANNDSLEKDPKLRLAYVCLKLVYRRGFSNWMQNFTEKDSVLLASWITEAKSETTNEAIKRFGKTDPHVEGKVEALRGLKDKETAHAYFIYLTQMISQDAMQSQNDAYASNSRMSQEVSNFVNDFKKDVVIRAFVHYLKENDLSILLFPNRLEKREDNLNPAVLNKPESFEYPLFYLALHLLPAEAANHLRFQLTKYHTVLAKSAKVSNRNWHTEELKCISHFEEMFDVYLARRNAMTADLSGITKGLASSYEGFYETPKGYSDVFGALVVEKFYHPSRGLKELIRHSNITELLALFDKDKITNKEIARLKELEETQGDVSVGKAQQDKTEKHTKYSNGKRLEKEDVDKYVRSINCIREHRELKNKIFLNDVKRISQLKNDCWSRLIGFVQLRERDSYFILLALSFLDEEFQQVYDEKMTETEYKTNIQKLFSRRDPFSALSILVDGCGKQNLIKQLESLINQKSIDPKLIRNALMHFNHAPGDNDEAVKHLLPYINSVRDLLSYDRKLRNSVTKSIIQIFERANFNLIFELKSGTHDLKVKEVKVKEIQHLSKIRYRKHDLKELIHRKELAQIAKKIL